jgi:hypothetical protein
MNMRAFRTESIAAFFCFVVSFSTMAAGQEPTEQPSKTTLPTTQRLMGKALIPVPRTVRIELGNRSTGRISVQGWDRDEVEARALSSRGEEVVIFDERGDERERKIFLKADYANKTGSGNPTDILDSPPIDKDDALQIHLEVSVPRSAQLDRIRVIRSNVQVVGVDTTVTVESKIASVILKQVGPAEVHTREGGVEIENARGYVQVTSTSGPIRVKNSTGGVRANSIAGSIELSCITGRVDVATAQAPIELLRVDGDVEAMAASSSLRFVGPLREDGRYMLKTLSGRVEMLLPASVRGFNAALISYQGLIETDFSLQSAAAAQDNVPNRRVAGRYGNGSPQIVLDSFDGLVRLTRISGAMPACK